MKYRLIHYFDVWGNQKDGYEINNLCEEAIINFKAEYPSESEILKKLKKINFLKNTCRLRSMRFDYNRGETIQIEDRNGRPICRIEPLKYEIEQFPNEDFSAYHKEYFGINIRKVSDEPEVKG